MFRLQALVFTLVAAAITNLYITQPVLPIIQQEFGVSAPTASLTVSVVILGIALANLPFGWLADRYPVPRLIAIGAAAVAGAGFICAATNLFPVLVASRFVQGLFLPALSTCVAAYLSRNLPLERLNVAMGSYVSATVAGGLGGRLLGGWLHPPLHWRWAFVTAAVFLLASACAAVRWLPQGEPPAAASRETAGFLAIFKRRELRRTFLAAFGAFFVFSSGFNYLPFYLAGPPFGLPVQVITILYLTYIVGIVIGPIAGALSNRVGNGAAMMGGALVFALALVITLIKSVTVIAVALLLVCAGFFTIHACGRGVPQPPPHRGAGAGQFFVRAVLLSGRGLRHYPQWLGLHPGRLARGGGFGPHGVERAPVCRLSGSAGKWPPGNSPGREGKYSLRKSRKLEYIK